MQTVLRSTSMRLTIGALASAVMALFLIVVSPFPSDVHGQAPSSGAPSTGRTAQPVTARPPVITIQTGGPPAAQQRTTVAQQPVALPRSGTGLTADSSLSTSLAVYTLLALAAALGSAAVVLRVRRFPR